MRATIALLPLLALAACGDDATVEKKDATTAEVAKSVADAGMKLQPGRWELTMNFKKFDVEGMPPEAKQAMQQMMGQSRTFASCLTKEEAEKPDGSFFGQQGEDCRYDSFTMGDGKIDATMTCKGSGSDVGTSAKMKMAGTYSADSYDMTMNMDGTAPNGKTMSIEMAMASKHVGECKGDETS
ncbi:DUF3617 domain-containing protein [Novosphingobium sp. ERN07]|uniref:DUF3617 domain-containing protein n=1 Tax=Novosphingobium sp. ERN07 TaxID=2726187 RepID=UPI00145782FA|nr:DUF3617 domain-containing protein [Novosphingobium sp. ERN07]NLR72898.1 DUF3617 domain-containing protein [Novosphingobium sp. ERN07]